jgi:hypothetical protein
LAGGFNGHDFRFLVFGDRRITGGNAFGAEVAGVALAKLPPPTLELALDHFLRGRRCVGVTPTVFPVTGAALRDLEPGVFAFD